MTLDKLNFSDISFSTNVREHQEHIRSQETSGKHLVYYLPNIFVYCYNAGVCALFPYILFVISGTENVKYLSIFLCSYSLWIVLWRLNYYLSYITTKVESIHPCMFLQKIIKFFNLKQK